MSTMPSGSSMISVPERDLAGRARALEAVPGRGDHSGRPRHPGRHHPAAATIGITIFIGWLFLISGIAGL